MLKGLFTIGGWLLPPLAVVALPMDAPEFTCLAMLYLYLGGVCLALGFFIRFFVTRKKPEPATAFFLVAMLWLLAWQYGFTLGARIHLVVNEGRYMQKIRELDRAASAEEKNRICGDSCMSFSDGRIAVFHYCHCPFNWPDLVYDPSGALDAPRDDLQKLDLYLHGSKRLSKFWYIGYFGD